MSIDANITVIENVEPGGVCPFCGSDDTLTTFKGIGQDDEETVHINRRCVCNACKNRYLKTYIYTYFGSKLEKLKKEESE